MNRTLKIHADRPLMDDCVRVAFLSVDGDNRYISEPLRFRKVEPGEFFGDPALRLSDEEARMLMDELWNAGVRPTQQGSAGQLGAVQEHLEDMRAIAFAQLDLGIAPVRKRL